VKVNNISLKQEGGQMTEQVEAQPQQQSVDPAIQQISDFISQAIEQGQNPAEVVMALVEQQVDQQTIGQALMMNGFEENDIISLFEQMSQGQQPEEQVGGEPMPVDNLNQSPEELTEDESMHSDDMSVEETEEAGMSMGKSGIEIKPENEGKFTRWAEARGMSAQEAASKVMANTNEYPPAIVKMANFAKNAAGWKKEDGGENYQMGGVPQGKVGAVNNVAVGNRGMNWQKAPLYINPMQYEYTNDNFSLGKAAAVAYGGYKEFLSGADENKDGVKDGFFRDGDKKSAIRDASKGNYYNYKVTQDANDPNKYMADNIDLYNTSKNQGSLRTVDQYGKDVMDNSRFNYNVDTNSYNFIPSSRPIDERIYDSASSKNALAGKDYNYLNQMLKDKDAVNMLMGTKDDPEAGLLSIDQFGTASSTMPGKVNPNEYNTYMGINKLGVDQTSMIPTGNNGQPAAGMFNIDPKPVSMMATVPSSTPPNVPQKSFKDWYISGDKVRNGNKSEAQLKSDYESYLIQGFKDGGSLDKAQVGLPNWLSGMVDQNAFYDPTQQEDMLNYFKNMGQTNYAQDTQAVADAQLQKQNPGLGATPQQQQMQNMFTPQQGVAASTFPFVDSTDTTSPTFESPTVERTNKLEGGFNRFLDSPAVQGYGKLSNFAVKGADVINDYFRDKNVNKAREDNFNKLGADYQYATAEDPFNKRGLWDVNTGTAGSEGDRTTGLYMSKYGGENSTVNVDSNLLAKLIAAGADIEIL
jgi:hypothetical protein